MYILVADDDQNIRKIISKTVQKWGYSVLEAENGNDALKILTTDADKIPQIAILDWNMPGNSGLDICKILQHSDGPFIYCIMLTARTTQKDLTEALENGAHDFQSKPVNMNELRSRLIVGTRLVEANNKLDRYARCMENIAREKAHQLVEAERKSRTDDLTGSHSRSYFMESGHTEFDRCKLGNSALAIIIIDIDHFKHINDIYGHIMGDQALIIISNICRQQLRECDLFARIGGDEYAALISDIDEKTANTIAERIYTAIQSQTQFEHLLQNRGYDSCQALEISYGVAMLRDDDATLDDTIHRADQNMYVHKRSKGNV